MRHAPLSSQAAPLAIAVVAFGMLVSPVAMAARKDKTPDRIWTHPQYASFPIDRIAMLPVVTFDSNLQAASLTEGLLGQALRPAGYRWIGPTSVRDILRGPPGGDSLLKVVGARLLVDPRPDSLAAPRVCGLLRCDAMLGVRIDLWQQYTPEWNQSGKPSTTVQLHAAMVDSLGRLLWSASGSHTVEGPYFDPNAGLRSVKDSGLDRQPMTNQAGAPSYREVLMALVNRWAPLFPARPAAPSAATPPAGTPPTPADSSTVAR